MKPDRDPTLSLDEPARPAAPPPPQPSLCLALRSDDLLAPPRRIPLGGVTSVLVGRGDTPTVDITRSDGGRSLSIALPDRRISTSHARLLRVADQWTLEDSGSKNGTLLNGVDCVRSPLDDGDLLEVGCSFLLFEEVALTRGAADSVAAAPAFATLSPTLAATCEQLARVAPSTLPLLFLGESGVGKEVAARTVHELSGRSGAFVAVNCGALPESLIEPTLFGHRRGAFTGAIESRPGLVRAAHRGTLLLDEVGELSPAAQVALLRVLQEREVLAVGDAQAVPVDTRIMAATNVDLAAAVAAGRFRQDLLARLSGLVVQLPPLRQRRCDLGLLVAAMLRRLAPNPAAVSLAAGAARALLGYDWPLNVRELEMSLRRAGELAGWGRLELANLPDPVQRGSSSDDPRRDELMALLTAHGGNVAAVARVQQTSRMQVHRLLKRYGLALETFRK